MALAVVAVDVLTKVWAVRELAGHEIRVVGDVLVFRLSRNPGGAFGSFPGGGTVLAAVAVVAVAWVLWYAGRVHGTVMLVGLGLVAGGALGNLVDRVARSPGFLRGHVVDFVDLPRWPTFNVADVCVSCGVVLVVIFAWRDETSGRTPRETERDTVSDAAPGRSA